MKEDKSEVEFKSLLANLIVIIDNFAIENREIPVIGLALTEQNEIIKSIGLRDVVSDVAPVQRAVRNSLIEQRQTASIVATCIAVLNKSSDEIIAALENRENYCSTVRIPIIYTPRLQLMVSELSVDDGEVSVFPIARETPGTETK